MPFANEALRYGYDKIWSDAESIAGNAEAEPDDTQFSEDVKALIRWRKGETDYPFADGQDANRGDPGWLDIGLPTITIGNSYPVIDARAYVARGAGYGWRPTSAIVRGSIHHSVGPTPTDAAGVLTALDQIANLHVFDNGWPDYAYHLTIDGAGRPILTGSLDTLRYIVGDDNRNNVAIVLLGDFTDTPPNAAMLQTLDELIGEVEFDIGHALDWRGHRETPRTRPTACPGATFDLWRPARIARAPIALAEPAIREWTYRELIDGCADAADARDCPRYFLVGAGIAESGPNQFAERYGRASTTDAGKRYAAVGDLAGLQWVIDQMAENGEPYDCSFGVGQQTAAYAPVGDKTMTPENVLTVRAWCFEPTNAIGLMADKLAGFYHERRGLGDSESESVILSLFRYNTGSYVAPSGRYAGNVRNYLRALEQARTLV